MYVYFGGDSGDFSGDSGDSEGDSGDFGDSVKSCDPAPVNEDTRCAKRRNIWYFDATTLEMVAISNFRINSVVSM